MRKLALTLAALAFAVGIALAADVPNVLDGNPYSAAVFRAGDGSNAAPAYSFSNDPGIGFWRNATGRVTFTSSANLNVFTLGGNFAALGSGGSFAWASTADSTGAGDLILVRDAGGTLAQRNNTTAQTSRLYNTFTDASNYERLNLAWTTNELLLQTAQAGTGTARNFILGTNARRQVALTAAAPACTTNCGTSPSVAGSDSGFTVTMGASGVPASGWVITFAQTFTNAPSCAVTMALTGMVVGKQALTAVTTTTTLTVVTNGTAPAVSDKYHVICIGV